MTHLFNKISSHQSIVSFGESHIMALPEQSLPAKITTTKATTTTAYAYLLFISLFSLQPKDKWPWEVQLFTAVSIYSLANILVNLLFLVMQAVLRRGLGSLECISNICILITNCNSTRIQNVVVKNKSNDNRNSLFLFIFILAISMRTGICIKSCSIINI